MKRTWIETVSAYLTLLGIGHECTEGSSVIDVFSQRGSVLVTSYIFVEDPKTIEQADSWCRDVLGTSLAGVLHAVEQAGKRPEPLPTELEEQTVELSDSAHCTV